MKLWRHLPIALLVWGVAVMAFGYGLAAATYRWFPYPQMMETKSLAATVVSNALGRAHLPYVASGERRTVIRHAGMTPSPGLTLISGVGPKGMLFAKLVDFDGRTVHAWDLDWFRLWSDARHVPDHDRPKQRPGTEVHGMLLSAEGELTFNYEELGTMRVDICGRPKWRLPRITSHSLTEDDEGNIWTIEHIVRTTPDPRLPNLGPPFVDYNILKLSPQGQVLRAIPLSTVLIRSGYRGLLYMDVNQDANDFTKTWGDTLHLNSVEIFPAHLKSDYFRKGDILVSIRNLNGLVVIDPETLLVRKLVIGRFVRQHDPRFLDGSTITVFDNNNVGASPDKASSRLVAYSVKDDTERVLFEGTPAHPFYTYMMGKQRRLANGDFLLTEAVGGRILEVSAGGEPVWEFYNHAGPGLLGLVTGAQRIAPDFLSFERLKALAAQCPGADRKPLHPLLVPVANRR